MTVSYQYDVASSSTGGFFRLLWRWRGSIWKLLYKELLLFISLYLIIALSYDYLMSEYYKRYFERIVIFCSSFVEIIPLSFILGFYVSFTATRWWQQYTAIPWPDKLMNIIALYVPGSDDTSRMLRRTLMRYLNLTLVLVLRSISIPVKRRFPTKDHLIEAGFMTKPELEMYSSVPSHEFNTFWIPCTWFVNLLREARSECRITDSGGLKLIMEEFNEFRTKCGLLWSYDWVSIPLVYTQVVTLSTQAFFLASLLGRQHIHQSPDASPDKVVVHQYGEYYFPIFTLLQFILYMGLLKLGEQLINPFGDDDEDFELNWIIDRHVKVSFLGVDILNSDPPPLMKDQYFDEMDIKLPYTEAAVAHKVKTYRGSVAAYNVPTEKHNLVIPEFDDDDNNGSDNDNDTSTIQSSGGHHQSSMKSSVWNVFASKKHTKLTQSQSIPSMDSETMVETGLNPMWSGGSIGSMDTDMTTVTAGAGAAAANYGHEFQGIRGSDEHQEQYQPQQAPASKTTGWSPPAPAAQEFIIDIPPAATTATSESTGGGTAAAAEAAAVRGQHFITSSSSTQSVQSLLDMPLLNRPIHGYGTQPLPKDSGFHKPSISSIGSAIGGDGSVGGGSDGPADSGGSAAGFGSGGRRGAQLLSQSVQQIISERVIDALAVQRSHSSAAQPAAAHRIKIKVPKSSIFKSGNRVMDPRLRIRPFKSRVTFSDDTKKGDLKQHGLQQQDVVYYLPKIKLSDNNNSSSELSEISSELATARQLSDGSGGSGGRRPTTAADVLKLTTLAIPGVVGGGGDGGPGKAELLMRRQSLDPSLILLPKPPDISSNSAAVGGGGGTGVGVGVGVAVAMNAVEQENWLHHQSLPNIQEGLEDSEQQILIIPAAADGSSSASLAIQSGQALVRQVSVKRHTSDRTSERRKSFKRQQCSHDPIETTTTVAADAAESVINNDDPEIIVALIDDTDIGADGHLVDYQDIVRFDLPFKKKRKDMKQQPKQSSTESDTGSYHTANSFLGQISEDREDLPEFLNQSNSSVDSYTSATDEPKKSTADKSVPHIIFTEPSLSPPATPVTTSAGSTAVTDSSGAAAAAVTVDTTDQTVITTRCPTTTSMPSPQPSSVSLIDLPNQT